MEILSRHTKSGIFEFETHLEAKAFESNVKGPQKRWMCIFLSLNYNANIISATRAIFKKEIMTTFGAVNQTCILSNMGYDIPMYSKLFHKNQI